MIEDMDWTGVYVIYALASGFLAAVVARSKNRDEFAWFLLGGLFGILSLIAIAGITVKTDAVGRGGEDTVEEEDGKEKV